MQKRHSNPRQYFDEQVCSTQRYIVPIVKSFKELGPEVAVLEIGCGEAGNLMPFLDLGCQCTGVDFSIGKIEKGKEYYANHPHFDKLNLISNDIYQETGFLAHFDIIIVRDVIEHIHDQNKFLGLMKSIMAPNAIAFFAFPPWQNPFGGHQQICENKWLSMMPYIHLLPVFAYKAIMKMAGESTGKIEGLLEVKETGISIERFERHLKSNGYRQLFKTLYLINPNYETKFGLKPRKVWKLLGMIPFLRNFYVTTAYYVIDVK